MGVSVLELVNVLFIGGKDGELDWGTLGKILTASVLGEVSTSCQFV